MKALEQLAEAGQLGRRACLDGRQCVPAHDAQLMAMLAGRAVGHTPPEEAKTAHLLDAWLKGWAMGQRGVS